tara:strand:+ start:1234 stop:2484 length:1251 start_codon:yes stop_codon:yes gene_type:complete
MNRTIQADKKSVRRLRKHSARGGFTLIELLLAISIVSMLAAMITVGLSTLGRQAQIRRCEQQVKKIDELIQIRFNELINKPIPVQFPSLGPNPSPANVVLRKQQIMVCRRELMRMELPDRITDILDPSLFPEMITPASTNAFRRKMTPNWSAENQGSECLYLILSIMQDQDSNALDFLFPSEIGDTDKDGMPEILDAFGTPLGFLRWAPGISARPGSDGLWGTKDDYRSFSGIQGVDGKDAPDWTDVGGADPRHYDNDPNNNPFHLYPLISSAGPDEQFGIFGLIRVLDPDSVDLPLNEGINPETDMSFNGDAISSVNHLDVIKAVEKDYETVRDTPLKIDRSDSGSVPHNVWLRQQLNQGYDAINDVGFRYRAINYDPFYLHPLTYKNNYNLQFGSFIHNGVLDNITNHDIEEAP